VLSLLAIQGPFLAYTIFVSIPEITEATSGFKS